MVGRKAISHPRQQMGRRGIVEKSVTRLPAAVINASRPQQNVRSKSGLERTARCKWKIDPA